MYFRTVPKAGVGEVYVGCQFVGHRGNDAAAIPLAHLADDALQWQQSFG